MNKKNSVKFLLLAITICALAAFSVSPKIDTEFDMTDHSTKGLDLEYTVCITDSVTFALANPKEKKFSPKLGKSFLGFKEALGFKESQNNYFTVNSLGYLGKYQFGRSTLALIGINNTTEFLNTPELQENAFIALTSRNKWVLRKDIKRFVGKSINGIRVTESGILAAAHLAGPGGVKKYLRSYGASGFSDAYGTSIGSYMKRFSGYDTSVIKPNKAAKVRLQA
ncbi:peptidoglycan-binding protein LysM [Bizionia gelidisalsuginis]|uniref:Peptidoglycan-binding protein LysM n=2 Tax=Bizionia TaxID=283785 RepID=A0A8H2LIA0_9FLAO|nr:MULTISPECIES: peptidoglycan-binding protein LysM [Bizionia]TYB77393.1 peptidoglycan-binding protein LysM [Bizionia saleffrena]TYC17925.1 peptidoglycan-binding protein LysM [Bizionia gelidisalsuginis]